MDSRDGGGDAISASCPEGVFSDYVLETEDRDGLSEPTFSSPPRLAFRQPGDSRAYPRSRSDDKLPLVVELDLASQFGSSDDIENPEETMKYKRLTSNLQHNGKDYKSIVTETTASCTNSPIRVAINSDSEGNNGNYNSSDTESMVDYHCHSPKPEKDTQARNQLIVVCVLCAVFMAAEIVGGVLSNSLALISDATHMASDLSGLVISLFAIWFSHKPATYKYTYGFHRAEVLGALMSVGIIWVTTGVLVYLAVDRIIKNKYEINADEMLIVAGLGVAFNIAMGLVLQGGCGLCKLRIPGSGFGHSHSGGHHNSPQESPHHHSDNHSEGHRHSHGSNGNINVRAAFIHVVGDTIQSIGVLIAAFIIKYKPEYKIADPICTFIFSVLVLCTTVMIIRDIVTILMEGSPKSIKYSDIQNSLQQIPGVKLAHSLQMMSLSIGKNTVTAHLAIDSSAHWNAVLQTATKLLREKYGVLHSTIQVEQYQEDIMTSCDQCLGPKLSSLKVSPNSFSQYN